MTEFLQSAGYVILLLIGGWVLNKTGILNGLNTPSQRTTQRPTPSTERRSLTSHPETPQVNVTVIRREIEGGKNR